MNLDDLPYGAVVLYERPRHQMRGRAVVLNRANSKTYSYYPAVSFEGEFLMLGTEPHLNANIIDGRVIACLGDNLNEFKDGVKIVAQEEIHGTHDESPSSESVNYRNYL